MSKSKKRPEFKTEAEERAFWESHDSSDHVDWSQAKQASFSKLKPSTKSTSPLERPLNAL
ncbi:CopG family antitoxin [Modicisalibacter radicis]|uniref:CopG family antitoxin n=1 Tax=Halomonas sp. EAR18 TaxID=2518972 RepID=UPI00109C4048|nr:CopG family antitoxin [Halomonas sp. EAR18]